MYTRRMIVMMACALTMGMGAALAAPAAAMESFDTTSFDKVFDAALKNGKGALIVSGWSAPRLAPVPGAQLSGALSVKSGMTLDLDVFERATVNTFRMYNAKAHPNRKLHQYVDRAMVKRYGEPVALSVFVPGGTRPIWKKQLAKLTEHDLNPIVPADAIAAGVKEARAAFDAWVKERDGVAAKYGAKNVNDRAITHNRDAQAALAEVYAKGYAIEPALAALNAAAALIAKERKERQRLEKRGEAGGDAPDFDTIEETLAMRRGEIAAACEDHARAAKEYAAFAKKFKKSSRVNEARLAEAGALEDAGEVKAALEAVRKILADPNAKDIHEEARDLEEWLKEEPDDAFGRKSFGLE